MKMNANRKMDIDINPTSGRVNLNTLEPPPSAAVIRRIGDGFKTLQVLRAGYKSGLFDWLECHGPAEKSAIAASLRLRGSHLGGFLQALEDAGLLVRKNGAYALAQEMSDVLCATSPWCQAKVIDNLYDSSCGWSDLTGFMSEGWTPKTRAKALPLTLHPFLGEARRLVAYLATRRDLARVRHLLCFDGDNGLLAAALCQQFTNARVTVVVMPDALAHTEEIIATSGLAGRCRVVAGTPLDPPTAELFDYAVLFHNLYSVRKFTANSLAAIASRLLPGGELCCAHWFCLEACETAPGGMRDLDKGMLTNSHQLCHVEQFCKCLDEAGLINAERDDLAGEYGNTKLHFAHRPASA